jgi:hypothetical protein
MNTTMPATSRSDIKKTSVTFRLAQRPGDRFPGYPTNFLVPSECEILYVPEVDGLPDQSQAYPRLIRYIPGMPSIFVDEWTDADKNRKGKGIKFTIGFRNVPVTDKNLLLFLRLSGHNQANNDTRTSETSILYKEIDYEADSRKQIEKERLTTKAMYFVNEAPIEEVKAYAQSLCTNKAQIDTLNAMDEYSIRASLINLAKTKPETFIEELQASDTKNKVFVIQAIYKGVINIDDEAQTLSWPNGELIVEAPKGVDVIGWFSELTVKNDKYKAMFISIKELLDGKKQAITPTAVEEEVVNQQADPLSWQEKLVEEALESGLLQKNGQWYSIEVDGDKVYNELGKKSLLRDLSDKESPLLDLLMRRN